MNKKPLRIVLATLLLISSFLIIIIFTSETGEESDQLSLSIAERIEYTIADHFYVNHHDEFWETTLNQIIRKLAHFLEFAYAGVTTCIFFLILIRRRWVSISVSFSVCTLMALTDEFRQQFVSGRLPRWFDVKIDICGALFGILAVMIIYGIYTRIKSLKDRIRALEGLVVK